MLPHPTNNSENLIIISLAFRAAGISTPSALSKLTLADYDGLGVVDVNERKKLFYLVQRIKMAVRESETTQQSKAQQSKVGESSCKQKYPSYMASLLLTLPPLSLVAAG